MSTRKRFSKRGFTLVELLVVIAIIGVLVGLLLPAVQAAREAARRMQCSNSIRQLALGAMNHETAYKALPQSFGTAGARTDAIPGIGETQVSWLTGILPYIEQVSLHQQVSFGYDVANDPENGATLANPAIGSNAWIAQQPITLFRCPSDTTPRTPVGSRLFRTTNAQAYAVTSYKGVSGSNWAWGLPGYTSLVPPNPVGNPYNFDPFLINNGNGLGNGNGIFYAGYLGTVGSLGPGVKCNTTVAAIKDGLSNTFMVGEAVGSFSNNTWWYSAEGSTANTSIPLNVSAVCQATGNRRVDLTACADDWANNSSFMSEHSGGANFAAADGSVRFVANSIELNVYHALGSMADGVVAPMPE